MVKKLPIKLFKNIYSKVPRLCVDIIIMQKKEFVLSKRDIPPCKGMWHIPGGTVIMGESLKEAVKRIAKEETNLEVSVKKQLGVREYSRKSAFGQAISVVYLADALSSKLVGNKFARDVRFFKKIPKNIIKEQRGIMQNVLKMI